MTLRAVAPVSISGTALVGGTPNGVLYLDNSGFLSSGSALTFDGTNLTLGATGALLRMARLTDGSLTGSLGSRTSGNFSLYNSGGSSTEITVAANDIRFDIGASEQMRLTTTGLGIGTSSPGALLHTQNTGEAGQIIAGSTGSAATTASYMKFVTDTNTVRAQAGWRRETNQFKIQTTGTKDHTGFINSSDFIIDSSGNLGIGTTSPRNSANYKTLTLNGSTGGEIDFTASDALVGSIYNTATSLVLAVADARDVVFRTNGSERARITSDGNLLVGTTASPPISGVYASHAFVQTTSSYWTAGFIASQATPWGIAVKYDSTPNGTTNDFIWCADATDRRFMVRSNGGIANYQANNSNLSDRREKTNLNPAPSYIDKICAIPVQTFNYIDQNLEEDPGLTLGVVAQDVQAVAPELVMESDWSPNRDGSKMRLSIYQTDLQYALMKCIQEQQAIINDLKARLDAANL